MPPANRPLASSPPRRGDIWVPAVDTYVEWLADQTRNSLTSVAGTASAFTATDPVPPSALAAGQRWLFTPHRNCAAGATLQINAFTAKALALPDGTAVGEGDLFLGYVYPLEYDGTKYRVAWDPSLSRRHGITESEQLFEADARPGGVAADAGDRRKVDVDEDGNIVGGVTSLYRSEYPADDDDRLSGFAEGIAAAAVDPDSGEIGAAVYQPGSADDALWQGWIVAGAAFVHRKGDAAAIPIDLDADTVLAIEVDSDRKIAWTTCDVGGDIERRFHRLYGEATFDASVTDVWAVFSTGQSNATGYNDEALIDGSDINPGFALMFNGGIRVRGDDHTLGLKDFELADDRIADLVDAAERKDSLGADTGLVRLADTLAGELTDTALVVATFGHGSTTLSDTGHNMVSQPGRNMVKAARRLYDLCAVHGKTLRIAAVLLLDGEGEVNSDSQATWEGKLDTFQVALQELKAITGQAEDVLVCLRATANSSDIDVQSAQLAKSISLPDAFVYFGPGYFLPHDTDNLHFTPAGNIWSLQYAARTIKEKLIDVGDSIWPHPVSAVQTTTQVDVTFDGDFTDPLQSSLLNGLTDPGNKGVSFSQTGGAATAISTVTFPSARVVRVTFTVALSGTNKKIFFAATGSTSAGGPATGARTTIADSDADTATINAVSYPMLRRAPPCSIAVT